MFTYNVDGKITLTKEIGQDEGEKRVRLLKKNSQAQKKDNPEYEGFLPRVERGVFSGLTKIPKELYHWNTRV